MDVSGVWCQVSGLYSFENGSRLLVCSSSGSSGHEWIGLAGRYWAAFPRGDYWAHDPYTHVIIHLLLKLLQSGKQVAEIASGVIGICFIRSRFSMGTHRRQEKKNKV